MRSILRARRRSRRCKTQARLLAFNSAGVLSFKDVRAAKKLLASLHDQPTVRWAVLYDDAGQVLATFPDPMTPPPAPLKSTGEVCRYTGANDIEVVHRVTDHGEHLGTLYLCASTADLRSQLIDNAKMVGTLVVVALGVSFLLVAWMQRSISGPIQRLADAASRIGSAGDYSIRVERQSEDELGILCNEFNRMLDRVQTADRALKDAADELEQRVVERTRGVAAGEGIGRGGERGEEPVPGQHEPRNPHPAERGHRLCRPAAAERQRVRPARARRFPARRFTSAASISWT